MGRKSLMKLGITTCALICILLTLILVRSFFVSNGSVKILRADNYEGVQTHDVTPLVENLDLFITWYYQGELIEELKNRTSMKVLLYRNVRAIYSDSEEWEKATIKGWILKDASGQLIHNTYWSDYYLADIGNIEYQDFVTNWIKDNIDKYCFDGVMADYGLNAGDALWYRMSGKAINPRTGNPYTAEEWVKDLIKLVSKIKAAISPKIYFANGIHNGVKFHEYEEAYLKIISEGEVDGFKSEGLFYSNEKFWYSEQEWKQSLDLLIWVQENFLSGSNRNRIYVCWQDARSELVPTGATQEQLVAFVYASCLLGIKWFSQTYVTMHGAMLLGYTKQLLSIKLGTPKGDYYVIEGTLVYSRDFTKVKVLVNPTFNNYRVDLGDNYYLNGHIVSSITMKPHTGVILQVATYL